MRDLAQRYKGGRAVVIMGGPSLVNESFPFGRLRDVGVVTFIDPKALTPKLLSSGLTPDFLLMMYPEKAQDNALQHFLLNALQAGFNLLPLLRPWASDAVAPIAASPERFLVVRDPSRGQHKRFRWRPGVELQDSPYALLSQLPTTELIANAVMLTQHFPDFAYPNPLHLLDRERAVMPPDLALPERVRDQPITVLPHTSSTNSSAIQLFEVLKWMGFAEVYMLGLDMTMLGSMEYAAPFAFKSPAHHLYFMVRARNTFGPKYRINWPRYYYRPRVEFAEVPTAWAAAGIPVTRVYDPSSLAAPLPLAPSISSSQFWERVAKAR